MPHRTHPLSLLATTAALLLGGCLDHPVKEVKYDKIIDLPVPLPLDVNRDVDILFVIDNSGSMAEEQALLSANFAAFINVLEAPDVRANYRIGITTTDVTTAGCKGTTPENGRLVLSSCQDRMDQGEFVFNNQDFSFACDDFCSKSDADLEITPTLIDADRGDESKAKPRRWLESYGGRTNVAGVDSMVEAFQCYGPQGVAGCGFESHLEAMYLSLAAASDPGANHFGFLRDKALLSVVFISDETDCSVSSLGSEILTPANKTFWADPDDRITSAICWNAGVACTGDSPNYSACHSENYGLDGTPGVPDNEAVLQPLSRYTKFLQQIEDAKLDAGVGEVLVSLIAGVPQGYEEGDVPIVYADADNDDDQLDFGIGPGCILPSTDPDVPDATAIPPVREREFAEAFEVDDERNLYSICQNDYSKALEAIARAMEKQLQPSCMPSCVFDSDPELPLAQPNCELHEVVGDTRTPVPSCEEVDGVWTVPEGATVCFAELTDNSDATPSTLDDMSETCIDRGVNLEYRIERSEPALFGAQIIATCQLSKNKRVDCPMML